ncbi:STAS domain-containing protein [Rhodobacter sp. NSM]|uniref:STAS domain-containing protein n=1 Tax=Rhodobacter sp. NSM TaxID=3457501 RepID=UPI003FD46C52
MPASHTLVSLPPRAGLREAGPLAAELAGAIATLRPIRIKTDEVEDVGLPIVQLLVAAHRQARAAGVRIEVPVSAGSPMAEALAVHGLGPGSGLVIADDLWIGLAAEGRHA